MKTKSITRANKFTVSRTLGHVLVGTLVLTAFVLMMPSRSDAAIRINARIGNVRVGVRTDVCCPTPTVAPRRVVVRSEGRKRIVVRNESPVRYTCGGVAVSENHHHKRHGKAWVPGHFETKVKRHGRLKKVWVPGHWVRI